jgi:hypothetical protein
MAKAEAPRFTKTAQLPAATLPEAGVWDDAYDNVRRRPALLPNRAALALLLLLASLHSAIFALWLPPWGLIDEAQHVHYIQHIAEQQAFPIAGESYLSDAIVASLFATRRWETFHWPTPTGQDARSLGLEGHSYEAYQPPLYYLLMAPLYLALPSDILAKVYGLRMAAVALSLVTVWAVYRVATLLLPHYPNLPFFAGLLLVALPERTLAISRVNNDVLLEALAALCMVLLVQSAVSGPTAQRGALVGLLIGLGGWAKLPMVLLAVPVALLVWTQRRQPGWGRFGAWALGVAGPLVALMAIRNLWLYGDLTGFAAFDRLHRLAPVERSLAGLGSALVSLHNHLWLVWWKGSEAGGNWAVWSFYGLMALATAAAWGRLLAGLVRRARQGGWRSADRVAVIFFATVLLYGAAVFWSYLRGMVPVIQGRLLLPAIVSWVILLAWGLWGYRHGPRLLLGVIGLLAVTALFSLFGNLAPYYYYWSGVITGELPTPAGQGFGQLAVTLYRRALLDKPPGLGPWLVVLPILYLITLAGALAVALAAVLPVRRPNLARLHLQPAAERARKQP